MAGKPELDEAIAEAMQSFASFGQALTDAGVSVQTETKNIITIIAEMTAAFSRLLQQIAAGSPDLQSSIDQIHTMKASLDAAKVTLDAAKSTLDSANESLVSAIAQAKVEGN